MYHYVSHVFGLFHPSNTGDFPVTHSSPSCGKAWYPEQWRARRGDDEDRHIWNCLWRWHLLTYIIIHHYVLIYCYSFHWWWWWRRRRSYLCQGSFGGWDSSKIPLFCMKDTFWSHHMFLSVLSVSSMLVKRMDNTAFLPVNPHVDYTQHHVGKVLLLPG